MEIALGLVGVSGLVGMSWLFPVAGLVVEAFRNEKIGDRANAAALKEAAVSRTIERRNIAVLMPAHNEASVIKETLESIFNASRAAVQSFPSVKIRVLVGADGCTDNTAKLARESGAEVLESRAGIGKWATLKKLVSDVPEATYIVFADSGVIWPENFLKRALEACGNSQVMAVAPSYKNPGGGKIETALWNIERHFKSIENSCGGPVSIHGATVLYRREELEKTLKALEGGDWLNDDVVIPLLLRAQNPNAQIIYLPDTPVYDQPNAGLSGLAIGSEWGRRKRMVFGNVQWIKSQLPKVWSLNPTAAILALRRVFRLLWAYWGMALALCVLMVLSRTLSSFSFYSLFAFMAAAGLSLRRVFFVRRLIESAVASFIAPYCLLRTRGDAKEAAWQ